MNMHPILDDPFILYTMGTILKDPKVYLACTRVFKKLSEYIRKHDLWIGLYDMMSTQVCEPFYVRKLEYYILPNGQYHGPYKSWRENGILGQHENYILGKQQGWQLIWYRNGNIHYESYCVDGNEILYWEWRKNGMLECLEVCTDNIRIRYHANGSLESFYYLNQDGLCQDWYDNRQLRRQYFIKNKKWDGLYQEWYENGNLWKQCLYVDGYKEGAYQEFYIDGDLGRMTTYVKGIRYGPEYVWYERDGKISSYTLWDDDLSIYRFKWDQSGNYYTMR